MLRNGGGASAEEEEILGKFEWNKNEAVVHWDEKVCCAVPYVVPLLTSLQLMPIRRKAWSGRSHRARGGLVLTRYSVERSHVVQEPERRSEHGRIRRKHRLPVSRPTLFQASAYTPTGHTT